MFWQGTQNLLGSTSPAASTQNENSRASDGSKANAHIKTRPLEELLEFLAASFNISIFELAGVLHNAKDYKSLCSNLQECTLVLIWLPQPPSPPPVPPACFVLESAEGAAAAQSSVGRLILYFWPDY